MQFRFSSVACHWHSGHFYAVSRRGDGAAVCQEKHTIHMLQSSESILYIVSYIYYKLPGLFLHSVVAFSQIYWHFQICRELHSVGVAGHGCPIGGCSENPHFSTIKVLPCTVLAETQTHNM